MPIEEVHSYRRGRLELTNRLTPEVLRLLLAGACIVIISWGIKSASDILSLILLGFLLAYSALPLLNWLIRRFHLSKTAALTIAIGLVGSSQLVIVLLLYENIAKAKEKLPFYEARWLDLSQSVAVFLHTHGIHTDSLASPNLSDSNELVKYAQMLLPAASHILSNASVVVVLGGVILSTIVAKSEKAQSRMSIMNKIQGDVAHYIGVSAMAGSMMALANLALLVAFGVDFPLLWSILYFFLQFVPKVGVIIALIPPCFLALLMLGWRKALLVAAGLVVIQVIANYIVVPMLRKKKGVTVSFTETMLSMMWWGFLFGPAGSILAIPLTLSLKRAIPAFSGGNRYEAAPDAAGRE